MSPSDYELIEQGYDPPVDPIAALYARVAQLETALKDIAKQMLTSEMDAEQADYADYADYTGAYEAMIMVARAALKDAPQ